MAVIIYADFNCPYSYLASQRADALCRSGVAMVDWRAVEHDRNLPLTGTRSGTSQAGWDRGLAEVASLALPGEHAPTQPPTLISNTQAAVAAYAEAVSDNVAGELRRRIFAAIWAQGRQLSSAAEVRRLVTAVMWPQEDPAVRLASPEFPNSLIRDPDLARIVRRSGGTIANDGGPLTTVGWQRIRQWRQEWQALSGLVIPAVIGTDQILRSGASALRYLTNLGAGAGAVPPSRTDADIARERQRAAAAWLPSAVTIVGITSLISPTTADIK